MNSFFSFFFDSIKSLLEFLIDIFEFSEYCEAILVNSFLLSSLNLGIGNLIKFPSICGLIPRLDSSIEFSIFFNKIVSQT